jgi:hypothetical protein
MSGTSPGMTGIMERNRAGRPQPRPMNDFIEFGKTVAS